MVSKAFVDAEGVLCMINLEADEYIDSLSSNTTVYTSKHLFVRVYAQVYAGVRVFACWLNITHLLYLPGIQSFLDNRAKLL